MPLWCHDDSDDDNDHDDDDDDHDDDDMEELSPATPASLMKMVDDGEVEYPKDNGDGVDGVAVKILVVMMMVLDDDG